MPKKNSKLLFWITFLGNTFEHYDTALFALLSPFIASQFFPQQDPLLALILTYLIIPIGMLAKPFGSLFFGYIGDTYGRKKALFISFIGMSIISLLMAFAPVYSQVGLLAPIIISLIKILQSFFSIGESVGGAVYLLENTETKKRNFMSGVYSSSTIGGILLASTAVSLLSSFDLIENGWRVLYLIGCLTGCFGLLLRLTIEIEDLPQQPRSSLTAMFKQIWMYKNTVFTIGIVAGFSYSTYIVSLVMMNGFIPLITDLTKSQVMYINTLLLFIDFLTLPLFGFLGSIWSREKLMIYSSSAAFILGVPLFSLLEGGSLVIVALVRLCIVLIGVCFSANFYSWSQDQVPPSIRYTVIGFSSACGSQLFGGTTASISLWIYQQTHNVSSAGWYWIALGLLSTIVVSRNYSFNRTQKIVKGEF